MYDVWIAPLFIVGTLWGRHTSDKTHGKDGRMGKGERRDGQEVQRTSSMSSNSSSVMFIIIIWSFLVSMMLWMKGSLHFSSGFIRWYWTWKASSGRSSLILGLSVLKSIFLRLEPVVDLASWRMEARRCFEAHLLDFRIYSRNLKNLLIKIVLMCLVPLVVRF